MRTFKNLSDHDFELFVADLLGEDENKTFEVFARGADRGVDLRAVTAPGTLEIVQCKHMEGSTYAQLRSAVRKEASKLATLDPQPIRYRLVTTQTLTPGNKTELRGLLAPWIKDDHDVIGGDDLEILLTRNPAVEGRNIKLWLSSRAQLDRALRSATWARSRQLFDEIAEALPRFVDTGVFMSARGRLYDERVVVLSGPPGIGKTSVARMLVADAVARGHQPIEISEDIEEANAVFDERSPQVFIYDDFLGATFLQDRLSKNEDKRLAAFLRRCRRSKNTLFILTTREHILQQATRWYEELERADLPLRRLLIELRSYSRRERALILYNHIYHSSVLQDNEKRALSYENAYLKIIDHPNYNPRIVEHVTERFQGAPEGTQVVDFALANLNSPERIWEQAFHRQLDADCRKVVLVLATISRPVTIPQLQAAFEELARYHDHTPPPGALRQALRILDDSFTRSVLRSRSAPEVEIANPSVADFVGGWLRGNIDVAKEISKAAVYFEQVEWLRAQVGSRVDDDELDQAIDAAFRRTFGSPHLGWWPNSFDRTIGMPHNAESRLLHIIRNRVSDDQAHDEVFLKWQRQIMDNIALRWNAGETEGLRVTLQLASLLAARRQLTDEQRASLDSAARLADTREDWEAVADSLDESESPLGVGRWDLSDDFQSWVDNLLMTSLDEVEDVEALDSLEWLADQFGVISSVDSWSSARHEIENREVERSTRPTPERGTRKETEVTDAELQAIFGHLTS